MTGGGGGRDVSGVLASEMCSLVVGLLYGVGLGWGRGGGGAFGNPGGWGGAWPTSPPPLVVCRLMNKDYALIDWCGRNTVHTALLKQLFTHHLLMVPPAAGFGAACWLGGGGC